MNSQQVKQAFAAAGIRVRVADQGPKFRICTLDGSSVRVGVAVAASIGLTAADGTPGGFINQPHEMFSYKPGVIRHV